MPAKPPKMPKNPTQEQLDDYSNTLEQYFKDKERELAEQQLESDRTLAELNKEKANVELIERETLELQERNVALQEELEKKLAELDLVKQSHENVWREEAGKLDKRRVELVEERRRLENTVKGQEVQKEKMKCSNSCSNNKIFSLKSHHWKRRGRSERLKNQRDSN